MRNTDKVEVLEGPLKLTYVNDPKGTTTATFENASGAFQKVDKQEVQAGPGLYVPKGFKLRFKAPTIVSYEEG